MVSLGMQAEAVDVALRASWIAGDRADLEMAHACRRAALWLLRRHDTGDHLLKLELHRRLGEFEAAAAYALSIQTLSPDPRIAQVAGFQLKLTRAGNDARHSMVDVFALEQAN